MKQSVALLLLVTACQDFPNAPPQAWGRYQYGNVGCSAGAVGEYLGVTAGHCAKYIADLNNDSAEVTFHGQGKRRVLFAVLDGKRDSALLVLDEPIVTWTRMAARRPIVGESVHFYSAFSGSHSCWVQSRWDNWYFMEASCHPHPWHGDSGAPVVNDDGEIVGVVSAGTGGEYTQIAEFGDLMEAFNR